MRLDTTFSENFDSWYNTFNQSENGKKLLDAEGISRRCLDIGQMSHLYFTKRFTDVTIDANANSGESKNPNAYGAEIVKGAQKLEGMYLLHRYAERRFGLERANKLLNAIVKGDVYFHDSTSVGIQEVYCTSISTTQIMIEGRPYGQLYSLPPKRASAFLGQVTEMIMDASVTFSGAIAVGDVFTNYSYYAKKEDKPDKEIIQDFQRMVHVVNNQFRIASQSPFSNLSVFDMPNLEKLFEHYVYPDGSKPDFDYVMHIQKIFCKWFSKGDPASGFPYRFPVVTLNLSCDENKNILDEDFLNFVSDVNCERACFNIYINSGQKIASCCRILNDLSKMPKIDTFGNGSVGSIGSVRVVTLNLPRLAIKADGDVEKFINLLKIQLENARDLLLVHREDVIKRRIDAGFLRFFKPLKWLNIDRYFCTFGIIGVYEANHFMGFDIRSNEGIEFTTKILKFIEEFGKNAGEQLGFLFNVEEIPGESVASKLVEKDKVVFGEERIPFMLYSNQYLPLIAEATLPERIQISGKFQDILSGGGILHLNVAEQIKDPSVMKHLIIYSVQNSVSHFAVNYGFGECKGGHVTICGNSKTCSLCGEPIVSWATRIVGYLTKVDSWSKVRREFEFPRRVFK